MKGRGEKEEGWKEVIGWGGGWGVARDEEKVEVQDTVLISQWQHFSFFGST